MFIDFPVLTRFLYGKAKISRCTIYLDSVSIDPSAFYIVDIIIDYVFIYTVHKLPISKIRIKVRLHHSKFHNVSLQCCKEKQLKYSTAILFRKNVVYIFS